MAPQTCDACQKLLVSGLEVYYEVSMRVRPVGDPEVLAPEDADMTESCAEAHAVEARLEAAALDEMLSQSLRPTRYTLCGPCRSAWLRAPFAGVLRPAPARR